MKLKLATNFSFNKFMSHSLFQAKIAFENHEVPVGSTITHNNYIIASTYNKVKSNLDPTAHAEILCIREAAKKLRRTNLTDCTLYTTLEPCPMCAQAISLSKIKSLYFAAYDNKLGAIESGIRLFNSTTHNHIPEIYGGIMEQESKNLMKKFFIQIRHKC